MQTARLLLRPFALANAVDVQRLAHDRAVSSRTARLPYPYTLLDAQEWICSQAPLEAKGRGRVWAITHCADGVLLGAISLDISIRDRLGTLGYWLGRAHWGHGYATEAAQAVVAWGMKHKLGKVAAQALANNAASIAVLRQCGLQQEGILRAYAERDGARIDVCCFGLLGECATK